MSAPRIAAVVLVGGRAGRMGGIVKPLVSLGGATLWSRSRAALAVVGATPIVAVGARLDEDAGAQATADGAGAAVDAPRLDEDARVRAAKGWGDAAEVGGAAEGGAVSASAAEPEVVPARATVVWVREDPPFGGPVAGIAAALAQDELAEAEWMLLLAGDLVHPEAVVSRLAEAARTAEGVRTAEGARTGPAETGSREPMIGARESVTGSPEPMIGARESVTGSREPGVANHEFRNADSSGGDEVDGIAFRADGQPQWLAGIYRTSSVCRALAALGTPEGTSCRALLGGLAIRWIPDEDGITADIDTPEDLERARAFAGPDPIAAPGAAADTGAADPDTGVADADIGTADTEESA